MYVVFKKELVSKFQNRVMFPSYEFYCVHVSTFHSLNSHGIRKKKVNFLSHLSLTEQLEIIHNK